MLKLRRIAIDSWRQSIAYLHRGCAAYNPDEYLGSGKVEILPTDISNGRSLRATLNRVDTDGLLAPDELGLSPHGFDLLGLPEGATVTLERAQTPDSLDALRAKIAGNTLDADEIDAVIADIVSERYSGREISAFLLSAATALTSGEILGLARARARHATALDWPDTLIADKHSMGGIPGNRVTLVVIPIIAAHGMAIPKASSRAITSAAGTADTMEVLARVDLDADHVRRVVKEARGCIVWNGRLNHSPVDDVMNAVTRSLGIDSNRLSVASILSKKLAAGSTHVVIDIPVGPTAKIRGAAEAREMATLFEDVGEGLGLTVVSRITDGSAPIGRGVGPALEARDVMQILSNEPDAPDDLREKSLALAAQIIAFDPDFGAGDGIERARELLDSGAALDAMNRIIDLQGRNPSPPEPGPLQWEFPSPAPGTVGAIDCWRISGIARRAGAPLDKTAGIDLLKKIGDPVAEGEPLYRIHASAEADFAVAIEAAEGDSGFDIDPD
ncbi:MAG: thymidine phosphorylase family protein [Alphaproteobacteria bacterium]